MGGGIVEGPDGVLLGRSGACRRSRCRSGSRACRRPMRRSWRRCRRSAASTTSARWRRRRPRWTRPSPWRCRSRRGRTPRISSSPSSIRHGMVGGDAGPPAWFAVRGMVNPEAGLFSVDAADPLPRRGARSCWRRTRARAAGGGGGRRRPCGARRSRAAAGFRHHLQGIHRPDPVRGGRPGADERAAQGGARRLRELRLRQAAVDASSSTVTVTEGGKTFEKVESASVPQYLRQPSARPRARQRRRSASMRRETAAMTICYSGSATPEAALGGDDAARDVPCLPAWVRELRQRDWSTASKSNTRRLERDAVGARGDGGGVGGVGAGDASQQGARAAASPDRPGADGGARPARGTSSSIRHRTSGSISATSWGRAPSASPISPSSSCAGCRRRRRTRCCATCTRSSLANEYFRWVKNQGIERTD